MEQAEEHGVFVEEPVEAAPFLGELIPALSEAIDTIPDPEARDVATKTLAELERIREKATAAENDLNLDNEIQSVNLLNHRNQHVTLVMN